MRNIKLLLAFVMICNLGNAQGLLKKIKENKTVSNVVEGKKPITTNFKDVNTEGNLPVSFGEDKTYVPLHSMPKNEDGEYILTPGFYEITNLSYCLKAGTHGPGRGDAYGLAFLEGKMADIVEAILINSQQLWRENSKDTTKKGTAATIASNVFRLSQRDVQLLLWAIIAKADFESMAGRTKAVALALLTPSQIVKLNGGAVKTVTNFASDKGWVDKPEAVRKLEEAEQAIRALYSRADATYEDFEKLAILAGLANEPQPFDRGTWFKHEDGYFVRYEPEGYPRTTTKVYVPDTKSSVKFRATGSVATPSDSRQRLAQTDMAVDEYYKSPFGNLR
jgi:hypothetical protein